MSSERIRSKCLLLLLFAAFATANNFAQTTSGTVNPKRTISAPQHKIALEFFQHGQTALSNSELDQAERDFRKVPELDPQAGAAYANLGVIYMRRKQWTKALQYLEKAERLHAASRRYPAEYRPRLLPAEQFLKADPPFESVVRDEPNAVQPRYLLGLCYFFADRWAEAADALERLWNQESDNSSYLYVLSNAAHRAGKIGSG